jgi:hypothetical protein
MADIQDPNDALRSLDAPHGQQVDSYDFTSPDVSLDPFSNNWEGAGFDWSGSWLLNV